MDEHFGFTPPPKHIQSIPAVSIVIPMYNTEKYIGACLTSILAQTFQNFEVIVVNNCSTDNSAAVVESFVPKFGGRLRLSHTKKNSGGPGTPITKSLAYAAGKYVLIVDSDDLLIANALEKLYTAAETYQADFVTMERYWSFYFDVEKPFPAPENLFLGQRHDDKAINTPTVETNDISKRIQKYCDGEFGSQEWRHFVRRDLLVENEITVSNLPSSQDLIWLIQLLCFAKKILRIPEPLYVYRERPDSITKGKERSPAEQVAFWLDVNVKSLKVLDEFLSSQKIFRDNPQLRWQLLDKFEVGHMSMAKNFWFSNLPPYKFYEAFKKRLVDERGGDFDGGIDGHEALLAYLCTSSNFFRLNCMMMSQYIKKLEQQLNALQSGK